MPAGLTAATARAVLWFVNDGRLTGGVVSARVADLTKGVLRAMVLTRRSIVVLALLTVTGLGLGASTLLYQAGAAPPPAKPGGDKPAPAVPFPAVGEDRPASVAQATRSANT